MNLNLERMKISWQKGKVPVEKARNLQKISSEPLAPADFPGGLQVKAHWAFIEAEPMAQGVGNLTNIWHFPLIVVICKLKVVYNFLVCQYCSCSHSCQTIILAIETDTVY